MFMLRRRRACGEDYIEWRSQLDVYIFVRILLNVNNKGWWHATIHRVLGESNGRETRPKRRTIINPHQQHQWFLKWELEKREKPALRARSSRATLPCPSFPSRLFTSLQPPPVTTSTKETVWYHAKNKHFWFPSSRPQLFCTKAILFANCCILRLHKQLIVRALAVLLLVLVLLLQLCFVTENRFFTDVPIHNVGFRMRIIKEVQESSFLVPKYQCLKYSKNTSFPVPSTS